MVSQCGERLLVKRSDNSLGLVQVKANQWWFKQWQCSTGGNLFKSKLTNRFEKTTIKMSMKSDYDKKKGEENKWSLLTREFTFITLYLGRVNHELNKSLN